MRIEINIKLLLWILKAYFGVKVEQYGSLLISVLMSMLPKEFHVQITWINEVWKMHCQLNFFTPGMFAEMWKYIIRNRWSPLVTKIGEAHSQQQPYMEEDYSLIIKVAPRVFLKL